MRYMEIGKTLVDENVDSAFDVILRWELPDPDSGSSWQWDAASAPPRAHIYSGVRPRWLNFRTGILRWDEEIRAKREIYEIYFEQTEGDFADFSGKWVLRQVGDHVHVHYEITFDFGIESMAGILDPIAESAVRDVIGRAIGGMFGRVLEVTPAATSTTSEKSTI